MQPVGVEVGKNIKSAMGLPKKLPELPAREVMTWGWAGLIVITSPARILNFI